MSTIDDVLEFHKAFGIPVPSEPGLPGKPALNCIQSAVEHLEVARNMLRIGAENGCRKNRGGNKAGFHDALLFLVLSPACLERAFASKHETPEG